jgi:DNA-binding response OmpR family regulator
VSAKRSVLIVDDEFGLAEMLCEMLCEHGYEVSLAINGRLAFDILDERRFDLVITDMMMPVMDGFELARAMRKSDIHRATPILMMTSLPTRDMTQNDLFDGVIRKPFTPDLLLTTMAACLSETLRTNGDRRRTDRAG